MPDTSGPAVRWEAWLRAIGRGLTALGVGLLAGSAWPVESRALALPVVAVGTVCLLVAGRGAARAP